MRISLVCGSTPSLWLTYAHPPHKSTTRDAGVHYWDVICELGFEHAVEVFAPTDGAQCVAVGELGKDSDLVGVLELSAGGHCGLE